MFKIGTDFKAARLGATYDAANGQWWLWVTLFLLLQIAVLFLLQGVTTLIACYFLFGGIPAEASLDPESLAKFAKASLVGMLPGAAAASLFSWWCAGWLNKTGDRGIPLRWPKLGAGGWALTLGGVIVFLYVTFMLTFYLLGIDPKTYMPTAEGVNDTTSASGLVEKTMADLADEPLLFALALPGIIIGAPLSEELIFRGAFFSMLRNSWFGKTGAVVITAAVWSFVHGASAPWLFVFVIFIMGLLLGWLLLRFGSLWVTMVAHAAWNAFTSLAIFGGVAGS
jgi:uncharacterized protein